MLKSEEINAFMILTLNVGCGWRRRQLGAAPGAKRSKLRDRRCNLGLLLVRCCCSLLLCCEGAAKAAEAVKAAADAALLLLLLLLDCLSAGFAA
jgi:hypothetical protein